MIGDIGHPRHEFGGIVAFHELRHREFFLLIGGEVGRIHLLRLQLLAVDFGCEVPVLRVGLALVGMAVCHLVAVDSHHLRLTGLTLGGFALGGGLGF